MQRVLTTGVAASRRAVELQDNNTGDQVVRAWQCRWDAVTNITTGGQSTQIQNQSFEAEKLTLVVNFLGVNVD